MYKPCRLQGDGESESKIEFSACDFYCHPRSLTVGNWFRWINRPLVSGFDTKRMPPPQEVCVCAPEQRQRDGAWEKKYVPFASFWATGSQLQISTASIERTHPPWHVQYRGMIEYLCCRGHQISIKQTSTDWNFSTSLFTRCKKIYSKLWIQELTSTCYQMGNT